MTAQEVLVRDGRERPPEAFFEVPRLVYRDDPAWIPEEPEGVAAEFSAAHPWFRTGRAITVTLPGRSRAAGFLPGSPRLEVAGRPAAFFGFWESAGDQADDAAVLGAVETWARAQGAELLLGPVDFGTHNRYRLRLTPDAATLPFPGEPHNPPGYPARLEALGYALHHTYLTQVGPTPLARKQAKAPKLRALLDKGYRIEPLTPAAWLRMLPEMHRLVDAIFAANLAYTPLSFEDFQRRFGSPVARRMCPDASVVAYGPEGDIAGWVHLFPHYGPLAVQGAGKERVPASALAHDMHFPVLKAMGPVGAVARNAGTAPAHRRQGVMDALGVASLEMGEYKYTYWEAALIRADNPSRSFASGAAAHERWYGLFAKDLAAAAVRPDGDAPSS